MFKIGDNVIIKKLSEHDKTSDLLNDSMHKYQGENSHITHIAKNVSHIGYQHKMNTLSTFQMAKVGGG